MAATSAPSREEELVAAAQAGNREAFEALFRRYRQAITAYVRARVRDEGRTEDIVQETFFSAHNSLATLGHPRAFRPWLYQIAHNACLDEARRRRRNDELILGWDEFPPPDERIVFHHQGPDHQLSQKEELADLTHALGGLPPSQHEALVLREVEGMSYDEIGRRMQLSPGAVESVLFRARRGLKRAYSKAAALLPLPAFLRRAGSAEEASGASSFGAQAQGAAAQLSAVSGDHAVSLAHKAAAVVAAIAVVGGGTAAIETTGVLDSSPVKKDQIKPEAQVVGPAPVHKGAAGNGGAVPPGATNHPNAGAGRGGSSPSVAAPPSDPSSPALADPGAPAGTAPAPGAPGASSPGTSSPGSPSSPQSGTAPSSGSGTPQTNQPSSKKGTKSPAKSPQQLTTPAGTPIPTTLPPGIQKQLESGKRTLDDLPPGQQKKLAKGSASAPATAP
jgi:RNA polymerase sigma factor (sigma-70 family)